MRNSHAARYNRAYPLAYVLTLSAMLGIFSGCGGGIYGPKQPLPDVVDGCEYEILMGPFPPVILHCDEVHDLGTVRSDARVEIRVGETAEATHLDLSGFRNLLALRIDNSNIKTLDLSRNGTLTDVQLNMPGLVDLRLPAMQSGAVTLRNMPKLTELDTSGTRFHSLSLSGVLGFDVNRLLAHTEIRYLELSQLDLAEINLAHLENLQSLSINSFEFQGLNLPAQPISVRVSGDSVKELDLSGGIVRGVVLYSTAIHSLTLSEYDFGTVEVTNHKAATLKISGEKSAPNLEISGGEIENLDLQEHNNLTQLSVIDAPATTQIILPSDAPLTKIDLKNLSLSELDIPGYRTLERLDIQYVPLMQLTAGLLNNLYELNLVDTSISQIPLSSMPNLARLEIAEHGLSGLDFSANLSLNYIRLLRVYGFAELDLPHLNSLGYLWILTSDLSCDSMRKIADQYSGLGEGNFYLSDLHNCD
jgi:hypothetical protein